MSEITFRRGNLFESKCQALVNPVNSIGVMGAGLALRFKHLVPGLFPAYQTACRQGECGVGRLFLYKSQDFWVVNFPTKKHFSSPSQTSYISAGLDDFAQRYLDWGISTVAFPALGCGLGGLNWGDIRPLMIAKLSLLAIDLIEIYLLN